MEKYDIVIYVIVIFVKEYKSVVIFVKEGTKKIQET